MGLSIAEAYAYHPIAISSRGIYKGNMVGSWDGDRLEDGYSPLGLLAWPWGAKVAVVHYGLDLRDRALRIGE